MREKTQINLNYVYDYHILSRFFFHLPLASSFIIRLKRNIDHTMNALHVCVCIWNVNVLKWNEWRKCQLFRKHCLQFLRKMLQIKSAHQSASHSYVTQTIAQTKSVQLHNSQHRAARLRMWSKSYINNNTFSFLYLFFLFFFYFYLN